MSLAGFSVNEFRSFKETRQFIAPLSKINLLAGENNSGKSNVLRFAQNILGAITQRPWGGATVSVPQDFDVPIDRPGTVPIIGLAISIEDVMRGMSEESGAALTDDEIGYLGHVLDHPAFRLTADDLVWLDYVFERRGATEDVLNLSEPQLAAAMTDMTAEVRGGIGRLSARLSSSSGGAIADDLDRVIRKVVDQLVTIPPVVTVEAIRSIDASTPDFAGFSVEGD